MKDFYKLIIDSSVEYVYEDKEWCEKWLSDNSALKNVGYSVVDVQNLGEIRKLVRFFASKAKRAYKTEHDIKKAVELAIKAIDSYDKTSCMYRISISDDGADLVYKKLDVSRYLAIHYPLTTLIYRVQELQPWGGSILEKTSEEDIYLAAIHLDLNMKEAK